MQLLFEDFLDLLRVRVAHIRNVHDRRLLGLPKLEDIPDPDECRDGCFISLRLLEDGLGC